MAFTPASQSIMRAWAFAVSSIVFVGSLAAQTRHVVAISNAPAVEIPPGQVRRWTVTVPGSLTNCRVTGRVLGLAGGQKDVDVLLMTEDDFLNWQSNAETTYMFHSGQKVAVKLDIPIEAEGDYVFVVSNGFSQYSPKTVQMQHVGLTCWDPPSESDDNTTALAETLRQEEELPELTIPISNAPALDIPAGHFMSWTWLAKYPRNMCHVNGRVLGLAGGQKDVDVLVMTEDDFINWSSGHEAKVEFESGHKAAVPLNVVFHSDGESKYVFVVSNVFSPYTAKTVQMQNVAVSCGLSPRE